MTLHTTTTTKRKSTVLKRATLLIGATLLLTGCAKETTNTITIKNDSPERIEYSYNSLRWSALQVMQWIIDEQPTQEEYNYMINNNMTAHEASKVIEAANKGITAEDYIKANR